MEKLLSHAYISEKGLQNLKNYKYHGIDHSICAKYLQTWWVFLVQYLPLWLAPNLITLLGLGFIFLSFSVQFYYCPLLEGEAPAWTYLLHAFCLFMYQTLDALDGKQARRTGSSSPLGELFDHGCDAISTTLIGLTVCATIQVGAGWVAYGLMMVNYIAFYFAQWEEYHTGTLELGVANVTEVQIMLMIVHITTFFVGGKFWTNTISFLGFSLKYSTVLYLVEAGGGFITLCGNVIKIVNLTKTSKLNPGLVFGHLVPVAITVFFSAAWALISPTRILQTHPCAFLLAVGNLFSYLVGRIVLARVCQEHFSWYQPATFPIIFGFVNALLGQMFVDENYIAYGMCIAFSLAYLHFALSVIDELTTYLKIRCLAIPYPKNK
eukprot:TRINITY_DN6303_c0_g1_i2.p1 TRINITY_DN6303_c0_g1~~TRINITY_DN6303_c0_g1_i2.p1  ORF type:complete len:379 (+),score=88.02 TRINITY_DN6303_c0_g1_i2:49-1185(+)